MKNTGLYKFESEGETAFVKFNGWYSSYSGAEYEEWFYVEPRSSCYPVL